MSETCQDKSSSEPTGWDGAIQRGRELLEKAEERVRRLKGAIRTFSEYRDAGEPYEENKTETARW
jgi:hypothetical protein